MKVHLKNSTRRFRNELSNRLQRLQLSSHSALPAEQRGQLAKPRAELRASLTGICTPLLSEASPQQAAVPWFFHSSVHIGTGLILT